MTRTVRVAIARMSVLISFCLLVALGGCDRGAPTPTTPSPTPSGQTPTPTAQPAPTPDAPAIRSELDLTTLTLAMVSPMWVGDLNRRYDNFLRHVSVRCDARSWITPCEDTDQLIQALRDGDAQLALVDPQSLVQVLDEAPVVVFAMGLHDPDATLRSQLVAPAAGPIRSLEDAAGMRLALSTTGSLTGDLAPSWLVAQRTGQAPEAFFSQVTFTGSPISALRQVAAGQADVAVCDTLTSRILQPGEELTYHDFRILAESPPLPGLAVVMRSDLPTGVQARTREAFQNAPQRVLLPGLDSLNNRYRLASNSDYALVRDMIEALSSRYATEVVDGTPSEAPAPMESPDAEPTEANARPIEHPTETPPLAATPSKGEPAQPEPSETGPPETESSGD